ncbi:hypothetical protein AN958_05365 [Leucoagaricus sp. SymC.cos]|nr:hypothetical protein AN958_05365 [Leucoagaricus sp. SymC.cos]
MGHKPAKELTPPSDTLITVQPPPPPVTQQITLVSSASTNKNRWLYSPQKKPRVQVSIKSDASSRTSISSTPSKNTIPSSSASTEATSLPSDDLSLSMDNFTPIDVEEIENSPFFFIQNASESTTQHDFYPYFAEGVATQAIPFLQLSKDLYVVTRWDNSAGRQTTCIQQIEAILAKKDEISTTLNLLQQNCNSLYDLFYKYYSPSCILLEQEPLFEIRSFFSQFSAMVTHWPTAPKYVIYDFACQLAPYCRARELDFFADTLFLIDDFHSFGHSQCFPATFLRIYAQAQPMLGRINPSAAECGNRGLAKIRKLVSYMGQERAIMYTAVFLSIWNRVKIWII